MLLTEYLRLIRKWLWLLVIAALAAGGLNYLIQRDQPPVYEAQVMLSVGNYIQSPNPDSGEIRTGVELAQTYAVLASTRSVLQAAIDATAAQVSTGQLRRLLDISIVSNTSLLVLSVTHTDPEWAATLANAVAQQLISTSPTNQLGTQREQIALLDEEINRLLGELATLRDRLQQIDEQLADATTPATIAELSGQRSELVNQINQASATFSQLSDTLANLQERTNALSIVEYAETPTVPSAAGLFFSTLLSALAGVAVAAAAVFLLTYLDDTFRRPDQVKDALSLPVLGMIFRHGNRFQPPDKKLIAYLSPDSPTAESYRALYANLALVNGAQRASAYLFTSPIQGDGKSMTVANLAVTIALAGKRVLVIDADLRRPAIHRYLGVNNVLGLTNLLANHFEEPPVSTGEQQSILDRCLQQTAIPDLHVIASGPLPANPAKLLSSDLMQRWVQTFLTGGDYDVLLVDTSPVLPVADSYVLASATGFPTVLVIGAGRTRRSACLRAREQFAYLNLAIVGAVLNRVSQQELRMSYGYARRYYHRQSGSNGRAGQIGKQAALPAQDGKARQRAEVER